MALIVQKFGGTSVANIERIRHCATLVKREVDQGNQVAVVVSAMSGVTNQLVGWVNELSNLMADEAWMEYDSVVASGEQVTSGLLALALQSMGIPARSWLGWQIPLQTDNDHGKARIEGIENEAFKSSLKNQVAVVAGFQGIAPDGRITTLGRGGSDTSAVALAAGLDADRCDIFTDVDGVYTADPRIVQRARKLKKVAYEEMLEMASLGAKVLQTRSVEFAMKYNVRVRVLSSFEDVPGTEVVGEEEVMERRIITGITYNRDEARVTLFKVPNVPGMAAGIFGPLADAAINVDMIIQNICEDGKDTAMTFTVGKTDLERAKDILNAIKDKIGFTEMVTDKNVTKLSVVGVGMKSHAGVAGKMFATLHEKGVNILAISTSEIKISVLIESEYTELALRALHSAHGLDAKEEVMG
ncbi:aspartate kinase [bacterium]|nr:aspartate kinase [bacterium]